MLLLISDLVSLVPDQPNEIGDAQDDEIGCDDCWIAPRNSIELVV